MRKEFRQQTEILRYGEELYLEQVIKPVLSRLGSARQDLERKQAAGSDDRLVTTGLESELAAIDQFESRVKKHAESVRGRFQQRRAT